MEIYSLGLGRSCYGVTMQEQGVSKMLMLNLAEAEKRLKNTIK